MNIEKIRQFASSPAKFQAELMIPSGRGPRRFGDVMATFQRERFATLNPALMAVATGNRPPIGRHWVEGTKGSSKDSDLAIALLWLLCFSNRPLSCQVGAADADQAAELRKAADATVKLNPWLAKRIDVQNWKIVCEKTGSVCEIVAADATGSHGSRPDVVIINELSHITKQEFAETMMDNASKVPHGLVVIATNAGYAGTWQHKWRQLAQESGRWSFHALSRPAPWLDDDEIAEARRRNSTTRFNRLWMGIWAALTGDAIDSADIEAAILKRPKHLGHLGPIGPMNGTEKNFTFVAGLDLSTRRDHSALVVLGINGQRQRIRLASCESWAPGSNGQVDLPAVRRAVRSAYQRFDLQAIYYDPHQCELMAQDLRLAGVNMVEMPFTGANLNKMATALLESFRERRLDLYDDELLIRDLQRLSIVEKSYGYKLESTRDADGHADRAIAFSIALPAALELMATGFGSDILIESFAAKDNRYCPPSFGLPYTQY